MSRFKLNNKDWKETTGKYSTLSTYLTLLLIKSPLLEPLLDEMIKLVIFMAKGTYLWMNVQKGELLKSSG